MFKLLHKLAPQPRNNHNANKRPNKNMRAHDPEANEKLILIGGGHAHIQVIRNPTVRTLAATKILISDSRTATYSGLLPSVVAGLSQEHSAQIDLQALCTQHGFRFIHGRVVRMDTAKRHIYFCPNGSGVECALPYTKASVNVGSLTRKIAPHGDQSSVIYTRPIAHLVPALRVFEAGVTSRLRVVVIGAGAAGLELCFALQGRFARTPGPVDITLVSKQSAYADATGSRMRGFLQAELTRRGVRTQLGKTVVAIGDGRAQFSDGGFVHFDLAVVATGAGPSPLLRQCGLRTDDDGWLMVNQHLQSVDNEHVFGAGDCISFAGEYGEGYPPKAGVFAVRQGPVLADNLVSALCGGKLRAFVPQRDFLSLLSLGDGRGAGSKYGLVFHGTWVFRLKMYIDERWQKQFRVGGVEKTQGWEEDDAFDGSPVEGLAILLAGDDLGAGDEFITQLSVLKRMDGDEEFRDAVLQMATR